MRMGPAPSRRTASRTGATRGETMRPSVRAEGGEIDIAVSGIDRRGNQARLLREDQRRGERGKRRDADDGHVAGDPDGPRRGNADPEPCEGTRPDRDGNPPKGRESALDLRHNAVDERQQRLGMATLHQDRFATLRAPSAPSS